MIYLASPYSASKAHIIERRVRNVQMATAKLIEQGHVIFSPIVHSHPIAHLVSFSPLNSPGELSPWMKHDFAMIDVAEEVWVLMLEDWKYSRGVSAEIDYGRSLGKPVRFVSFPAVELCDE